MTEGSDIALYFGDSLIGGGITGTKYNNGEYQKLFQRLPRSTTSVGYTKYRLLYIKNDGDSDLTNFVIYREMDTKSRFDSIKLALATEGFNGKVQTVANENTKPTVKSFMTFNGSSDFIEIADSDEFDLLDFSIVTKFKTSTVPIEDMVILNKGGFGSDTSGENQCYAIWIKVAGTVSTEFEDSLGSNQAVTSGSSYNDGAYHIAISTYDHTLGSNNLKLYVDSSTPVAQLSTTLSPEVNLKPVRIGKNSRGDNRYYSGDLQYVYLYNRGLTATEVANILTDINYKTNEGLILGYNFGDPNDPANGEFFSCKRYEEGIVIPVFKKGDYIGLWFELTGSAHTQPKKNDFAISFVYDRTSGQTSGGSGSGSGTGGNDNPNTPPATSDLVVCLGGDSDCNAEAQQSHDNIKEQNPDWVLILGDLSYKDTSSCFTSMYQDIKDKTNVLMGNHEEVEGVPAKLAKEYLDFFNQKATSSSDGSYFSKTVGNMLFVVANNYIDFGEGSQQYTFLKSEMEKYRNDKSITWRIFCVHEPLYGTTSKHAPRKDFRDIYHPLMEANNFDLCYVGHNHNYQRSYPLKYNLANSNNPIINDTNEPNYTNPNGIIFVVAGNAGRKEYALTNQPSQTAKQTTAKGIIVLKTTNNGKTLDHQMIENSGRNQFDSFTITKT